MNRRLFLLWNGATIAVMMMLAGGCQTLLGGGSGNGNTTPNENAAENGNTTENGNDNGGFANRLPTVNAGADQAVEGETTVTLNGSLSLDPDFDALAYSWVQTAGTEVDLTGADMVMPTFTAPNVSETLTFELTVDDGRGGVESDTVNIVVTAV